MALKEWVELNQIRSCLVPVCELDGLIVMIREGGTVADQDDSD